MSDIVTQNQAQVLESVITQGDLEKLSPADRVMYYKSVCDSLGLNPLTKPFEYIKLNGKLTLYARKDCTEQLRKIHGISLEIKSREVVEDCYIVTVMARDRTGRIDESIGVVPIGGLKGEHKANAMMKADTKAKRRVTLSISGLGLTDESEVDSIPGAKVVPIESVHVDNLIKKETLDELLYYIAEYGTPQDKIKIWLDSNGAKDLTELPEDYAKKILARYKERETINGG